MKFELIFHRLGLATISLFCFFSLSGQDIYNEAGEYTYTIPSNITQIKVECWGAGGGGSSVNWNYHAGNGGGGGAYSSSIITVTSGNTYLFTVGEGGNANTDGGDSYFNSTQVVAAGGSGADFNNAGTGGTVANSTGNLSRYAGGDGANGAEYSYYGGGGGGSAGRTGAGGSAAQYSGGTGAGAYGGNGGDGSAFYDRPYSWAYSVSTDGSSAGGGGGGAYRANNQDATGSNGADGQVIITLPSSVVLSSPNQIEDDNVAQGTSDYPICSFQADISISSPTLNSLTFITSGTYVESDISSYKLWYSTSNDFSTATQIGNDINTNLGTGTHNFTSISEILPSENINYFWITIDVEEATVGNTISVNAISADDIYFDLASVTGEVTTAGTQTFILSSKITLSSDDPAVPDAILEQGTNDNIIYSFSTAISNLSTSLDSISFTTTGTYDDDDFSRFKLYYGTTNDFSTAIQTGSNLITDLGTGSHTITSIDLNCGPDTTYYFWITANVSEDPVNGHYLIVSAITTNNLFFSSGVKSGSTYNGGQQTLSVVNGVIITTSHPAVSATSLSQGDIEEPFYKFKAIISGDNVVFNSVTFTTAGAYVAADVDKFQLWFNDVNSKVSATQIGNDITTGLGTGTHTFNNINENLDNGETYYFWITVDITEDATAGNTLYIEALAAANMDFEKTTGPGWDRNVTPTVSTYDGGLQTIEEKVDTDGDGVTDDDDYDDDNDGIPDYDENEHCNTETEELFPNSGFEDGNTGFSSGYEYTEDDLTATDELYDEGLYGVVVDPSFLHGAFNPLTETQGEHGNIMVVNGAPSTELIVWSSGTITVSPYTYYTLSVDLVSVTTANYAQLIFNVNEENIGEQFNADVSGTWVSAQTTWYSGTNTQATFEIVNLNLIESGNDFALDNISCTYRLDCDTDDDGIPDRMDLDSDNDGIYDIIEAGGDNYDNGSGQLSSSTDIDNDGLMDVIDNVNAGNANEVYNGTALDNSDTDADGTPNSSDLDSDGDLCSDVNEAFGDYDADGDSILGSSPIEVDDFGVVQNEGGYSTPNDNDNNNTFDFEQAVPIINTQPENLSLCIESSGQTATFTVNADNNGGTFQWFVSEDNGDSWSQLNNGGDYSGTTTDELSLDIAQGDDTYDSNLYCLALYNNAYYCSPLFSDTVTLLTFTSTPAQPGEISGYDTVCQNLEGLVYSIASLAETEYYTWTVPTNWEITNGEDSTNMTVTSSSNGGNITVTATNICGTSNAQTMAVIVEEPTPSFIIPTYDSTVCQSAEITYITESGKSNYDWEISDGYGDYSLVSGGGSTDNYVTLKWTATGSKKVTVNYNDNGCTGTAVTRTVTVIANAIVLSQPQTPDTMCAGTGSATLSLTTSGTVSGYQWQVSTDGGTTWSNLINASPYSGVTTTTLTITSPSAALDSALYRCLIAGNCGNLTSNTVVLTVNATAIDSQSTAGQTICKGDTFSSIYITGVGKNLSYQWYSNTIASTTGGTSLGSDYGAQTDTLSPPSSTTGTRYYYCVVSGDCGDVSSNVSGAFIVNDLPEISLSVSSDTISFGSYADLSASGGTSYSWTSNPDSIVSDLNSTTIYNPRYTPGSNPTNIPPFITTYFKVNVTDGNNCSAVDSIDVTLFRKPETGAEYHIKNTWSR